MSQKPLVHGSFTIERTFRAPVTRLFSAWSDPELKARWFIGPERWKLRKRTLDLRVGGSEVLEGEFEAGPVTLFVARYHEIIPNERLVYAYDLHYAGAFLSISLASAEFQATPEGSRMRYTEQIAFLNGEDGTKSRELGTGAHFDRIGTLLAG